MRNEDLVSELKKLDENLTNGLNAAFRKGFYGFLSVAFTVFLIFQGWVATTLVETASNRYTIHDAVKDQIRHAELHFEVNQEILAIVRLLPKEFPPDDFRKLVETQLTEIQNRLDRLSVLVEEELRSRE